MKGKSSLAALALCLVIAWSAIAQAGNIEKAKVLYKAGAAAYGAGNYPAAIQAFNAAYALAPRPAILFNIAQAERRQYTVSKDPQYLRAAMKHLREYLKRVHQGGRRADAVTELADLEAEAARLGDAANGEGTTSAKQKQVTRLMVSCDAKGAIIAIDGKAHTDVPLIDEVKPGKHSVKVTAPGYFDNVQDVVAVEGSLVAVEIALKPRPARLLLEAPGGAEISIDGRPYGIAPVNSISLPAGAHTLTLTRSGRRPVVLGMKLTRGQTKTLHVEMKTTGRRKTSYVVFGVAGAAAVAGGVFVAEALHYENAAKNIQTHAANGNISNASISRYNTALDRRSLFRTFSYVSFGVAGGMFLTAGALYAFDHPTPGRDDEVTAPPGRHVAFSPVITEAGAGGVLAGSF